jgi:hypothetical protein
VPIELLRPWAEERGFQCYTDPDELVSTARGSLARFADGGPLPGITNGVIAGTLHDRPFRMVVMSGRGAAIELLLRTAAPRAFVERGWIFSHEPVDSPGSLSSIAEGLPRGSRARADGERLLLWYAGKIDPASATLAMERVSGAEAEIFAAAAGAYR